jgi:hypothetical protein
MNTMTLLVSSLLLMAVAHATDYSVSWSTVDGGGGLSTSTDGRWLLAGIAGQPDAGASTGGNFALEGGFWNGVRCAYGLRITHYVEELIASRPEYVIVSWPADDQGDCVLEFTTELHTNPALNVWTPAPFGRAGAFNVYNYEALGPARFFRLRAGSPKAP